MTLQSQIEDDVKAAMRAGETLRRDTLRMVLAAVKNKRIEAGKDLGDDEVLAVLASAVKSRKDSEEQYKNAGREELAAQETAEIAIIQTYLPQMLGEDETRDLVKALVEEHGIESKKDMGQLMKAVMKDHKGLVDGKLVQRFASEILA